MFSTVWPRWWSNSQLARLRLQRSEFESSCIYFFDIVNLFEENEKEAGNGKFPRYQFPLPHVQSQVFPQKWASPGLFFYFCLFNAVDSNQMFDKCLPMTGFKPRISGGGGDSSTNWATTTAHKLKNGPTPASSLCLFSFFTNTNCTEKTVGVSLIRTGIVRVEGKHDHHHDPCPQVHKFESNIL